MLLLTNEDLEQVLTMEICLKAVEDCTREIALGRVIPVPSRTVNQPLQGENVDMVGSEVNYLLRLMPVIDLANGAAILRINSVTTYVAEMYGKKRRLIGLPGSTSAGHHRSEKPGWLLLFDMYSSHLLAIIQDRHIQTMRVGATGGLSAKYMARKDAKTIGLLGTGWMAGPQLMAHCLVRDIKLIKVFSPNPEHRRMFAERMSGRLGIEVQPVNAAQEAVRGVDIVISATNSSDPTFDPEWVEPGTHVYCITAGEYDERMVKKADVIAWGYPGQAEHSHAAPGGVADPEKMPEDQRHRTSTWDLLQRYASKRIYLTDIITGQATGRADNHQITFSPSPAGGTAGIARFAILVPKVFEVAKAKGVGHDLPDDWFHQEAQLFGK